MEEKNKKLKIHRVIFVILVIIGIIMIGIGSFYWFRDKSNKPNDADIPIDNGISNNDTISIIKVDVKNEDNQIEFNGKKISVKNIDGILYFNNNKIDTGEDSIVSLYITNDYIILEASGENIRMPYAIDKDYNVIKICKDANGETTKNIEFVYDGKTITIKELEEQNTQPVTPKEYADWTSYVLEKTNIVAKVYRKDCNNESNNKTITLTTDQLKEIINKNKDNELTKSYSDMFIESGCDDYILVSYNVDGIDNNFEIHSDHLSNIGDTTLYSVLSSTVNKEDYSNCTATDKKCFSLTYYFKNNIDLSRYFK